MGTYERRNQLAKWIESGATNLAVNGTPYTRWLHDNLAAIVETDVHLELDVVVQVYDWTTAVKLADSRGGVVESDETVEATVSGLLAVLAGRAARSWLEKNRSYLLSRARDALEAPAFIDAVRNAFESTDTSA